MLKEFGEECTVDQDCRLASNLICIRDFELNVCGYKTCFFFNLDFIDYRKWHANYD